MSLTDPITRSRIGFAAAVTGVLGLGLGQPRAHAAEVSSQAVSPPLAVSVVDYPHTVSPLDPSVTYRLELTSGASPVRFSLELIPPVYDRLEGSPWQGLDSVSLTGPGAIDRVENDNVSGDGICAGTPSLFPNRLSHGSAGPGAVLHVHLAAASTATVQATYDLETTPGTPAVLWPDLDYRLGYVVGPPSDPGPPQPDWLTGSAFGRSPNSQIVHPDGVHIVLHTTPNTEPARSPTGGDTGGALQFRALGRRRAIQVALRTTPELRRRELTVTLWRLMDKKPHRFRVATRVKVRTDERGMARARVPISGDGFYALSANSPRTSTSRPDFACPSHRFSIP